MTSPLTRSFASTHGPNLLNPTQPIGRRLWAVILICVCISAATGFALYHTIFLSNIQLTRIAIATERAHRTIDTLDARINLLEGFIRHAAENPILRQSIEQDDLPTQALFTTQIKSLMPNAIDVRIFTQPNAELDSLNFPPVSFGTLKLLSDAFDGKAPQPRIQEAQGKKLLMLAYPIPHLDPKITPQPQGVLVIQLDFNALVKEVIKNPKDHYLQLLQGKQWVIYETGNSQWRNSPYTQLAHNAAGWNAKIFLDPNIQPIPDNTMDFSLIVILGSTLLGVFLFMGFIWVYRSIPRNRIPTTQQKTNDAMNETSIKPNDLPEEITRSDLPEIYPKRMDFRGGVEQSNPQEHSMPYVTEVRSDDNKPLNSFEKGIHTLEEASQYTPPASIFRAYDIRGIVNDTLTTEGVRLIGQALGTEALAQGKTAIAVGRDGRLSGDVLSRALISGIASTGCSVQDIGMGPTPLLYFAAKQLTSLSGVMLTGSHNPPNYNGLKMVINDQTLSGDHIQKLRERIINNQITRNKTPGLVIEKNLENDYIQKITQDIRLFRTLTVVVDAGNGVAGPLVQKLLTTLGCKVIPLFCTVDGNFPNHHPDPSKPENLEILIAAVQEHSADVGIALDGDGDRLGVVTSAGAIVYPDRLLMFFARAVLADKPNAEIIFDVKCTRHLPELITQFGGRPVMSKTGHSFIKNKLIETQAPLAGEMSGHIFFNDRWLGFDDGLYSAARLLELLSQDLRSSEVIFAELPQSISTPEINIQVSDENKFALIEQISQLAQAENTQGIVNTIDGIRIDYADGWGLIRASNTMPVLVARFEADTTIRLQAIQQIFYALLLRLDPSLEIPF